MTGGGATDEPIALDGGTVLLRRASGGFDVQLHRPQKRNALTAGMVDALHEVLDLAADERPPVIVLRGVPGAFSAGADIAAYRDAAGRRDELEPFTRRARDLCTRIETSDAVVVAVVDGLALGGGFELVLAADLVVASETSRFALPEVRLGLIPGWGGTQRLVRHVGPNRAKELILTGAPLTAAQAHAAGIVNLVVADDVDAAADAFTARIAAQAPLALRGAKAAINAAVDPEGGDTVGAELETRHLLHLFASEDGQEGVRAFLDKREPRFAGR